MEERHPETDRAPALEFYSDESYEGFGLSQGLARGLLVRCHGQSLTQEGMGIAAVALKTRGLTYFCRRTVPGDSPLSNTHFIDTVLMTSIRNVPLRWLSRLWHGSTSIFRRVPAAQPLLLQCDTAIRSLFRVSNSFEPSSIKGTVTFRYTVMDTGMDVHCEIVSPEPGSTVCLMNELGADWFEAGWRRGTVTAPPSSWQPLDSNAPIPALYSKRLDMLFSIQDITLSGSSPLRLYWGREQNRHLCWAGYTIEIRMGHQPPPMVVCTYRINLLRAGNEERIHGETCCTDLPVFPE